MRLTVILNPEIQFRDVSEKERANTDRLKLIVEHETKKLMDLFQVILARRLEHKYGIKT